MPSAAEVFETLEQARAAREAEVRTLQNLVAKAEDDATQEALRRSLVLVTYAHLEGYCKVAMDTYATTVNALKVPCSEATSTLVAATLHRAFLALRDLNSKHPLFPKHTGDAALHMTWREQQFAEQFSVVMSIPVEIPDTVFDTQGNLRPEVLMRNMYRLGLNYTAVDSERERIHKLLGKRNEIAHGEMVVAEAKDVEGFIEAAFRIMKFVQNEIFEALSKESYRKQVAA